MKNGEEKAKEEKTGRQRERGKRDRTKNRGKNRGSVIENEIKV